MGLIYGLVALGFNLIFGILGLIHFAHFEVYMIGAFGGLMAASYLKANIVIVLMAGMLSAGLLGILIEKTTFLPIREQPPESQLFASIAVSIILQNSALLLWGTEWLPFPKLIIQKNYSLGWIQVSNVQLIILALVILFLLGLRLGLYHTKIGVAIRAVSYNRSAATLMGINTDTTISITFGFGRSGRCYHWSLLQHGLGFDGIDDRSEGIHCRCYRRHREPDRIGSRGPLAGNG